MTPREEADRLVLLVDVVKWPELRDQIEAAIIAAEERGVARGVEIAVRLRDAVENLQALKLPEPDLVAVSPGLGCDGDVDL